MFLDILSVQFSLRMLYNVISLTDKDYIMTKFFKSIPNYQELRQRNLGNKPMIDFKPLNSKNQKKCFSYMLIRLYKK
jgi:hypothetical protein